MEPLLPPGQEVRRPRRLVAFVGLALMLLGTTFAGISIWVAVNRDGIGWRPAAGLATLSYIASWVVAWLGRPRDPNP